MMLQHDSEYHSLSEMNQRVLVHTCAAIWLAFVIVLVNSMLGLLSLCRVGSFPRKPLNCYYKLKNLRGLLLDQVNGPPSPASCSHGNQTDPYGKPKSRTWVQQHFSNLWFLATGIQENNATDRGGNFWYWTESIWQHHTFLLFCQNLVYSSYQQHYFCFQRSNKA